MPKAKKPKSAKPTPGPWKVIVPGSIHGIRYITNRKGEELATIYWSPEDLQSNQGYGSDKPVCRANAELMASAPTLKKQRNALLKSLEEIMNLLPSTDSPGAVRLRAMAAIKMARAKP